MALKQEIEPNIFTVEESEANVRIDKLLSDRFDSESRTYFQYLIEEGCVLLNGKGVKKRILPKTGDEIEVFFQLTPEISLEPEEIPLDILYEDEQILAVNKPPGMVVHPAPGNWSGTFVNALINHCKDLVLPDQSVRPGIVHRLDKDTSGVLLAAKTTKAHQKLISAFSERKVAKQYLAITSGKPQNGLLSAPIGRHPVRRKEMAIVEGGKEALSEISVLAFNEKLSLVLIKPQTGRTHQIRVHLKHLKSPVLGDELYGNKSLNDSYKIKRQLLHAYRLKFAHPLSGIEMELAAPIPDDFKKMSSQIIKS